MTSPTPAQIRAGRALLGWRQADLAEKAGLSHMTVKFIEQGRSMPRPGTMEKIVTALRSEGVEFGLHTITCRQAKGRPV